MKHSLLHNKFFETFDKSKINDIKNYYEVKQLYKRGLSIKDIKNKTNITKDKIYNWLFRSTKPFYVRTLEISEKRGYFNKILKKDLEWLAYLVGYNLGDGNISRDFCHTWFYGVNSDLEKIKKLLLTFKVNPVIYTYKINNGKMNISDTSFSRFLYSLGAVVGDKTKSDYDVPNWIYEKGKSSIYKKRFLQGLCDSELSEIKRMKDRRFSFQSLKYYMIKEEKHIKNGIKYMDKLRNMFEEFEVTSTKIKIDRKYTRSRDKSKMTQLYFIIHSNHQNLFNFSKNIGFLYTSKRVIGDDLLLKFKKLSNIEKQKVIKYKQAINLRSKGLSAYKISKILNFPNHYIKSWVYCNRKPRSICRSQ